MYKYLLALALVAVAFGKIVPGANMKHRPSNAGDWDCIFCEIVVSALEDPENRGDADKAEAVCSFTSFLAEFWIIKLITFDYINPCHDERLFYRNTHYE